MMHSLELELLSGNGNVMRAPERQKLVLLQFLPEIANIGYGGILLLREVGLLSRASTKSVY